MAILLGLNTLLEIYYTTNEAFMEDISDLIIYDRASGANGSREGTPTNKSNK